MIEIDAFILIGGRSSRMGRDKAFLELNGQTLSERTLGTVREAFPESNVRFVAANAVQFGIEAIRAGAPFVFDQVEGRGPLGGLYTALAHATSPWIFVMACDYPFATPELLRLLAEQVTDEYGAVVPEQQDGRLQPLCAFYKADAALPLIEEIIDRPRVPPPLHEIVVKLSPKVVGAHEYHELQGYGNFFININSTHDLDSASIIERKLSSIKQIK